VRNIAGAFGIAIFGTILEWREKANVLHIASLSHLYVNTTQNMATYIGLIELKSQVDAYGYIYTFAAILLFVGGIIAFFVKIPDRHMTEEEHQAMMAE
jgi:hypothetical protein